MTQLEALKPGLAVVIGINKYTNGIRSLKNAVNDAEKVTEMLQNQYGYQVLQLLDEAATLSQIQELLAALKKQQIRLKNQTIKIEENDRFFFYFSGHGIAFDGLESAAGPQGFLVPQDGKLREEEQEQSLLPMTDLHDALMALPSRHLLVILDCCFAGSFRWAGLNKDIDREEKLYRERYEVFTSNKAQQVITSAAYDEKALDSIYPLGKRGEIDGHSPFAEVLLKGLNGEADYSKDGAITATELYLYLQSELGKQNLKQTPGICELKHHEKGEYIFPIPGFNPKNLEKAPELNEDNNPYRGLASFDEINQDLFFGRKKVIEDLYGGFKDKKKPGLTAVLGASGTGKSSLVKAGLLPRLREDGWYIVNPFRPGKSPFSALAAAMFLTVLTGEVSLVKTRFFESFKTTNYGSDLAWEGFVDIAKIFAEILEEYNDQRIVDSLSDFLGKKPKLLTKVAGVGHSNAPEKLLLVIDQFEELVTDCSEEEKDKFLGWLEKILRDNPGKVRVIITLRSDFKAQFSSKLFDEKVLQFTVPIMTQDEYREIIEKPAAEKVLYFEPPGLVDELINEVVNMPGALPLLSFALSQLYFRCCDRWHRGEKSRAMTREDYQKLGGVMGALKRTAMDVFDKLIEKKKATEQTIRDVMLRMVSVSGDELARRRVPKSELVYPEPKNGEVEEVLNAFIDARLLVTGTSSDGEDYVEPAHDALVTGWDKILRWKNQEQESLLLQRRLTPAAVEWKEKQSGRFLWNANPYLDVLKKVLKSDDNWFNQVEEEFVWRSIWQKRRNVRSRWGIAGLAFVVLSSFTFAIYIQLQLTELRQKAAEAKNLLPVNPLDGLVLAIEATGKSQSILKPFLQPAFSQLQSSLLSGLESSKERYYITEHDDEVYSVAFSGQYIASGSKDTTIRLWDLLGNPVKVLEGHSDRVYSVAFSRDGKYLVSGGWDRKVKVWNLQSNGVNTFEGHKGRVLSVAFSSEKYIASGDDEGKIYLWDLEGNLLKTLEKHTDNVNSVAFSPDGKYLVSGGKDGKIYLWDLEENLPKLFEGHDSQVYSVAFSSDGQRIVSGSQDKTIRLWDLEGKPIGQPFRGHEDAVGSVAFSPDGEYIISGSWDKTMRLWDLKGNSISQPFEGHQGPVRSVAFSSDGQHIASGSSDKTIRLWDANLVSSFFQSYPKRVNSVAFSPNGDYILTASNGGTIHLWDLQGNLVRSIEGHTNNVKSVNFSSDGQHIISGGEDKTIRLWNLEGQPIFPPIENEGTVNSVAFSPDGKYIVSANSDAKVRLWNKQGNLIEDLKGHTKGVNSVAVSPNGEYIVSGSDDQTIRLWSWEGEPIHILKGHEHTVNSVAFSPDGKYIISGSSDRTVRVWDLKGNAVGQPFKGHESYVTSVAVAFSSDRKQKYIVSGSDDKTLRLWDWQGSSIAVFKGHKSAIRTVAVSPNGEYIVSGSDDKIFSPNGEYIGSDDKTLRLWQGSNWDNLLKAACDRLRYHSILALPASEGGAEFAAKTCLKVWSLEERQSFRLHQNSVLARSKVQEGQKLAMKGNIDEAVILFRDAQNYHPNVDLNPDSSQRENNPQETAINLAKLAPNPEPQPEPEEGRLGVPYKTQLDNWYIPASAVKIINLAMVLEYYGLRADYGQLEDELYESLLMQGLSQHDPKDLVSLAKSRGFNAKFLEVKDWEIVKKSIRKGYPVITFGQFVFSGNAVTIIGYTKEGFIVHDPYGEFVETHYRLDLSGANLLYSQELMDKYCKSDGTIWVIIITPAGEEEFLQELESIE